MAEKILAKLKEIWEKIVAKWNEFTAKQKTAIIAIAAAVVVAFVVLYAIISSPNYTLLEQCKSTKEASEITNVLKESNITFKVSDDGLQVKVPQKDLSNARLTLAGSGITTTTYTINKHTNTHHKHKRKHTKKKIPQPQHHKKKLKLTNILKITQ